VELDEALTVRANSDPALAALFGDRIHWTVRPQGSAYPALVLQEISEQRPEDLDGEAAEMRTARVQVDVLALELAKGGGGKGEAKAGIEAAIDALRPEAEIEDVVFWRAAVDGPRSDGEQTDNGFIYRASADLIIRYAKLT
jgi:hypothetical protein